MFGKCYKIHWKQYNLANKPVSSYLYSCQYIILTMVENGSGNCRFAAVPIHNSKEFVFSGTFVYVYFITLSNDQIVNHLLGDDKRVREVYATEPTVSELTEGCYANGYIRPLLCLRCDTRQFLIVCS